MSEKSEKSTATTKNLEDKSKDISKKKQ